MFTGPSRLPESGRSVGGMMTFIDLTSVPNDHPALFTDQLRLAVAAYLARFTGPSRQHTESDLRCYLSWCAERALHPHMLRHTFVTTMLECGRGPAGRPDRCPPRRPAHHDAL